MDEAETPDTNRDAASEAGSSDDAGMDLGTPPVRYMAQAPDGGPDLRMVPIYMAPIYMSSLPLG
jgi:hypothetical protein